MGDEPRGVPREAFSIAGFSVDVAYLRSFRIGAPSEGSKNRESPLQLLLHRRLTPCPLVSSLCRDAVYGIELTCGHLVPYGTFHPLLSELLTTFKPCRNIL